MKKRERERETRVKFCWSRAAADQQNHGEEPPFVFPWLQWRGVGWGGGGAVNITLKGRSGAPISRQ